MEDPIEFTPKEKFQIGLYKDTDGMFRRSVIRLLKYLVPSVFLVAYYCYSGDIVCGILGYAILPLQAIYRLSVLKRTLKATAVIHEKYEAQLRRKQNTA